jgi:hypothetical protein
VRATFGTQSAPASISRAGRPRASFRYGLQIAAQTISKESTPSTYPLTKSPDLTLAISPPQDERLRARMRDDDATWGTCRRFAGGLHVTNSDRKTGLLCSHQGDCRKYRRRFRLCSFVRT